MTPRRLNAPAASPGGAPGEVVARPSLASAASLVSFVSLASSTSATSPTSPTSPTSLASLASPTSLAPLAPLALLASFVALVAPVSFVASARAEPATLAEAPARALGRLQAWSEGAARGPEVAVAQAAAKAAGDVSGVLAGPSLPPRLQAMAGPRLGALGNGVDFSLTAMYDAPLRPLAATRADVAGALVAWTSAEVGRARVDAGYAGAVAWSRALEAKEVLAVRVRSEKDLEAIAGVAVKRLKAGVGLPSELALARGDLGAAGVATLDAEGGVVDAYAELRLAIGAATDEAIDPIGALCTTAAPSPDDKAVWAEVEERSPVLAAARARSALSARDVALAHATLGPTFSVGGQVARDSFGEHIFSAIVSVPLPFGDPARFDVARAKIASAQAEADVARVRLVLRTQVALALHDRLHSREVRKKLLDDALPPLREAVRLARVQYETGTQDLTAVLLTRQRAFAVEEQVVRACGAVHRADLAVAHLVGRDPT